MSARDEPTPEKILMDWMDENGVELHGATPAMLVSVLRSTGYRKPRTICFVILDGDASPQARYATKEAAEEVRDAWVAAHESAGVPYNFRVAEIVEATR